jgi:hypothetical protein
MARIIRRMCVKFSINIIASSIYGTNARLIQLTATRGPGPTHYRGFTITARYTTLGRTPLWTSDQPDVGISTRQNTTLTRER